VNAESKAAFKLIKDNPACGMRHAGSNVGRHLFKRRLGRQTRSSDFDANGLFRTDPRAQ
jgi:hypothetical protein